MLNYYFPEGATPMLARIVTTNMSQPNFPHMLFNIRTVTIMKWNINRQYLATCTTHPHPLCTNRQPQRPSNYFDRLEIYIYPPLHYMFPVQRPSSLSSLTWKPPIHDIIYGFMTITSVPARQLRLRGLARMDR